MRGRPLVGVPAVGDEQRVGRRVDDEAVAAVVLLRARQASDEIQLLPASRHLPQAREDPGVRVEVEIGPRVPAPMRGSDDTT